MERRRENIKATVMMFEVGVNNSVKYEHVGARLLNVKNIYISSASP